jgi:hypothetical protein
MLPLLGVEAMILWERFDARLEFLLLAQSSRQVIYEPRPFSDGFREELRLLPWRDGQMDRPIEIGFRQNGGRKSAGYTGKGSMHRLVDGMAEAKKFAVFAIDRA